MEGCQKSMMLTGLPLFFNKI